jgi:hypothetical protein
MASSGKSGMIPKMVPIFVAPDHRILVGDMLRAIPHDAVAKLSCHNIGELLHRQGCGPNSSSQVYPAKPSPNPNRAKGSDLPTYVDSLAFPFQKI